MKFDRNRLEQKCKIHIVLAHFVSLYFRFQENDLKLRECSRPYEVFSWSGVIRRLNSGFVAHNYIRTNRTTDQQAQLSLLMKLMNIH